MIHKDRLSGWKKAVNEKAPRNGHNKGKRVMVLEAVINGRARAIVAYNVADFAEAGERFSISIMRPAERLKKVKL